MNNQSTLTKETLNDLIKKFKQTEFPYDYILLTEEEERALGEPFDKKLKKDLLPPDGIGGIPFLSFRTKREVLIKGLELSLQGKRVLIIKEGEKENKVRKCAPELYDAMVNGGLIKRD